MRRNFWAELVADLRADGEPPVSDERAALYWLYLGVADGMSIDEAVILSTGTSTPAQ